LASAPKYQLKGNLSEKQIEADVARYLGWCTPIGDEVGFRLLDVNEQVSGADKLYDRATLIYIQFKKSNGLRSLSEIGSSTRKGRSKLEDIRDFRMSEGLECDPTLYFQLRAMSKTATDFQHNVLLRYESPPVSRAIYVAPLHLSIQEYQRDLFDSTSRFLLDPFYFRLPHSVRYGKWAHPMGSVPFLRAHVSIAPHEPVSSSDHYYAYSQTGVDISWHSPEVVSRQPSRLSDFLVNTFNEVISNPEATLSIDGASEGVLSVGRSLGYPGSTDNSNESALQRIQGHGRWLDKTYDIRQFVLLADSGSLKRMRSEI